MYCMFLVVRLGLGYFLHRPKRECASVTYRSMHELDAPRAAITDPAVAWLLILSSFRSGMATRVTVWGEGYLDCVVALTYLTRSYDLFGTPLS